MTGLMDWSSTVFANNLVESCSQCSPRENLDVLFNVTRPRTGKTHDLFEKLFMNSTDPCIVALSNFTNRFRLQTFQITTNPILFFHIESCCHQCLQEVDDVNAGNVAFISDFPKDAADYNAVWNVLFGQNWFANYLNRGTLLFPPKLNKSAAVSPFIMTPSQSNGWQISMDL